MIISFDQDDDFTKTLIKSGYIVSQAFVQKTTIPLGYQVVMRHLKMTYHVKNNELFLMRFALLQQSNPVIGGTLRDLYTFITIGTKVEQTQTGKVMVNPFPATLQQEKEQKLLLRFANLFEALFIQSWPINYILINLDRTYKMTSYPH